MLIYTPLPLEQVLEGYDKDRVFKNIIYKGVELQVEEIEGNSYRVTRLLSTNPSDFLNPEIQPGMTISAQLSKKD